METGQIKRIARAIGRCPQCKTVHVENSEFWALGGSTYRFCYATPECDPRGTSTRPGYGTRYKMSAVIGCKTEKTCGARCTNAVGPSCDCSCGGENHGMGHGGLVS